MIRDPESTVDHKRLQTDAAYRRQVFEMLVEKYQQDIYRYCVGNFGDTEGGDIAQEVFIAAWENLHTFKGQSTIRSWLFGISKNKCRRKIRDSTRHRGLMEQFRQDIGRLLHYNSLGAPGEEDLDREQKIQLENGIANLDQSDRILFNLRHTRGLQITEIAELTGESETELKKRLPQIIKRLRALVHYGMEK